jgi:hypothetical protein
LTNQAFSSNFFIQCCKYTTNGLGVFVYVNKYIWGLMSHKQTSMHWLGFDDEFTLLLTAKELARDVGCSDGPSNGPAYD